MSLHKEQLSVFGEKFVKIINECGIKAAFDDNSFRDYLLQISVKNKLVNLGKINVYYKPSKNSFSLVTSNIKDEQTLEIINNCWDKAVGFETYSQNSGIYEAFVDGSYIDGKTGYGAVIFLGDKKIKEFSGNFEDTSTRQFGGELYSVIEVLKWCAENGIKKIRINYDYAGIELFATGKWQPKNDMAKLYKQTVLSSKAEIIWRKIDSHTGNKKNDIADKLAKEGSKQTIKIL